MAHLFAFIFAAFGFLAQRAEADSFIDNWLGRQKAKSQDDWIAIQVISQMTSSKGFDQDHWLAKQKAMNSNGFLPIPRDTSSNINHESHVAHQGHAQNPTSDSGSFSHNAWIPAASWEAIEHLEESLLAEIQVALGESHRHKMEGRIKVLESKMSPMFQALPKNEYGKLSHPSVRYMLHRFFVEQHGWFIDGLFTEGAALNATSPSHMLKNRVPMFVEGIFEKRLGGRGFGVHEMAVLVAIVEHSVHQEAQVQLNRTFNVLGFEFDTHFTAKEAKLMIEAYMSGFVMSTNMSSVSSFALLRQTGRMTLYYPTWPKAQHFFDRIRLNRTEGRESISYSVIADIVKEIVDTFGTFHGTQCQGLKRTLQRLEAPNSMGCVRLPDFYEKGLKHDSNWILVESQDYMRHIGVLDETHPLRPSVLTANYINSPTNCLQPSGYYLVCCHNECDDILGQLEKHLAAPNANPDKILTALAKIKAFSDSSMGTIKANNVLSAVRFRLEEVAEYNGGTVPIHGRLFAQWLHHVYPRECPYPHLSGTKNPQWIDDFEAETGKPSQVSDAEMASVVNNASNTVKVESDKVVSRLSVDFGSCAPWEDEEELFAPLPTHLPLHALENDPHVWNIGGGISFLAAVIALVASLTKAAKTIVRLKFQYKMLRV